MQTLKLDPETWDVSLNEYGTVDILKGADALAQLVKQRLWLFRNEYWMNVNRGVPYDQFLGAKKLPPNDIIIDEIESIGYGIRVVEFNAALNRRTRKAEITFKLESDFGEINGGI